MSVKVIYHGHSNVEIHHGQYRVQIDPFYTSNPLADIKAEQVNPTHILLSHAHFDHVEDVVSIAKRTGAVVASNFEIVNHLLKLGAPKGQHMNHGGGWNFEFGRATYVQAIHTSTFPDGTPGGAAGGWVIEIGGQTIYFSGDTALFSDMKLFGELWKIDLAILPIGDCFTMGPAHAIKAAELTKTKKVIPVHYNTFPPITQNADQFAADLKKQTGIEGVALKPGGILELA